MPRLLIAATLSAAWNVPTAPARRAAVILGDDDIAAGVAQVKDLTTGTQEAIQFSSYPVPAEMTLAYKLDRIAARAEELRCDVVGRHLG